VEETGFNHLRGGYRSIGGGAHSCIPVLEGATDFLSVLYKSATLARQGCHVQLEQFNMRLALNMAKMATCGFSRATVEEMQYLI